MITLFALSIITGLMGLGLLSLAVMGYRLIAQRRAAEEEMVLVPVPVRAPRKRATRKRERRD